MEALVFVFILPIFLGLVVLCLTFGEIIYARMAAELAAREAARTYAVNVNQNVSADPAELAREAAASNMKGVLPVNSAYFDPGKDVQIDGSYDVGGDSNYCRAVVTVRVPIAAPFAERLLGGSMVIGSPQGGVYMEAVTGSAVFKNEPNIWGGGTMNT
jgi:Flp pilus assembly protein TadG